MSETTQGPGQGSPGGGGGAAVADPPQAPPAAGAAPPAAPPPGRAVPEAGPGDAAALLERLELPVEIRFGDLTWPLGKVLELRVGDALPIGPEDDDSVTLVVQGRPYARGDLVIVDGRFAFRVASLLAEEE